jgi:hypothetical protein
VKQTPQGEEVMHSGSVFIFDAKGNAREVATTTSDTRVLANDISGFFPK